MPNNELTDFLNPEQRRRVNESDEIARCRRIVEREFESIRKATEPLTPAQIAELKRNFAGPPISNEIREIRFTAVDPLVRRSEVEAIVQETVRAEFDRLIETLTKLTERRAISTVQGDESGRNH